MSLARDLRILYHLALSPIRGKTHAERLDSFYGGQAADYDAFRARLLRGREELYADLPAPHDGVWVEMGGGTGSNLDFLGDRLRGLKQVYIVDLSSALLGIARRRIAERGWSNVQAVQEDVITFTPSVGQADVVTFSYSLTMIPDWFAAIDHAISILKPGGVLGVVDFYVARKYPGETRRHSWVTRTFWPTWFALDNVFPSPDHVPYLQRRLQTQHFSEHMARVPYLPLWTPYYRFIGRKVDPA